MTSPLSDFSRYALVACCLSSAAPARAQSDVSGSYLVEVLAGRFIAIDDGSVTTFGARGTLRRSYERSLYVEVLFGEDSDLEYIDYDDGTSYRDFRSWRHTFVTAGMASTLIDRDATGNFGLHVVLGVGVLSTSRQFSTQFDQPGQPDQPYMLMESILSPIVDFSFLGELELGTPRIVLRADATGYLAFNIDQREYGGLWRIPGASACVGLAVGL